RAEDGGQRNGGKITRKGGRSANAGRHFPDVEQRVPAEPDRGGPPGDHPVARPREAGQKGRADEEEDQPDVADEVLVERPGGRDARYGDVPLAGRDEHEGAVGEPAEAERRRGGQASPLHEPARLAPVRSRSHAAALRFGGGTLAIHQSKSV